MTNALISKETWPNFLIVGAAKAGTTSLYKYLDATPGVYMSKFKEPNYFSSHSYPSNSLMAVVREKEKYLSLFRDVKDEKAIGEASTSYLYAPEAPVRIRQMLPEVRIIIILRDPVQRAFSHYLMNVAVGAQPLPFYEALQQDYNSEDKVLGISPLYVEIGLYSNQVRRYLDTFKSENIKVLFFEEFIGDTKRSVKEVLNFLDVEADVPENVEEAYNTFFVPRNRLSRWVLEKRLRSTTAHRISKLLPETRLKKRIRTKILGESIEKPKLTDEARTFLENIYREDVAQLQDMLERPLPWNIALH